MDVVALATGRVGSLFSRSTFALWRDVDGLRVFDGVEKRDVVHERLITDVRGRYACVGRCAHRAGVG